MVGTASGVNGPLMLLEINNSMHKRFMVKFWSLNYDIGIHKKYYGSFVITS